jgi:polysaccharide deacetylase 2 family uncharacterized protein YibQ
MSTKSKKRPSKISKKKKATHSSKFLLYTVWSLALVALVLVSLLVGYYFGFYSAKKEAPLAKTKYQKKSMLAQKNEQKSVTQRLQEVLQKESNKSELTKHKAEKRETRKYESAAHEIDNEALANSSTTRKQTPPLLRTKRPKLAIIIDDVSTRSQVKAIKALHMCVTMSFLPPSPARPNSAKLAAKESFYMVHLPMEAMHFSKEEPYTLRVFDTQEQIDKRIKALKSLFPKVTYINNHTGSKFTSNEVAMNRLYNAFEKYDIHFIDSRTTAKTKAPIVAKNFGLPYVARDVFLDHHQEKSYVLKQIRHAIKVAKSHGSAIAIGHPHKNTLESLAESKALLQQEVELVLVKDL